VTLLDRALFAAFLRSYAIVLSCLISLYVVIDLFTNINDFTGQGGLGAVLAHVGRYYGYRISQIFDRLSEPICLLAAVFTVAWLQRSNELLPQLSAGLPTRRVIRPVLFGSALMLALGPVNQEYVIPSISDALQSGRDDPGREKPFEVRGGFDSTGTHVEGLTGFRNERKVKWFFVLFPETAPSGMLHLAAEEAVYVPPGTAELSGGWQLYNCVPETLDDTILPPTLRPLGPRRYFLKTRDVDFDTLAHGPGWFSLASTSALRDVLNNPDPRRMAPVAVLFHMRLTRPLAGLLLVLLGLAVILRDQNRHVFISAGLCLVVCAVFVVLQFGCKYLGDNDLISPPLAAWLPVLFFGPVAIAQFDAIHT
jgi:lipopolysaccharide export system permease protein